jgi:transcriptional regulator with XRE-family HTH domain
MDMSELWKIVQTHLDEYGVSEAEFARRMGSSPQTLSSWKLRGLKKLPDKRLLEAVADQTRASYDDVLGAALVDIGYAQRRGVASGRSHHGAWELDHRILAELSLKGDELESYASTAQSVDEDDDIEDAVAAAHELADEAVQFVSDVNEVLEIGVGGRSHLRLLRTRISSERRQKRAPITPQERATDEDQGKTTPAPDQEADGTVGVAGTPTTGAAGRGDRKLSALPGGKQGSDVDGRLPPPDPADFLAAQTIDPRDASLRPEDPDDENQDHGYDDPV